MINPKQTPTGLDQVSQRLPWRSPATALSLFIFTSLSALPAIDLLPHTSLSAFAQSYPTLSAGNTGETVSQLQATLKLLGFYAGEISGTYDQSTANAVAQFQTAAGILADGVAGPSTWQKLLPAPSDVTATTQPADTPATSSVPPTPSEDLAPSTQPPPAPLGPPILRAEAEGGAVAQLQRELQTLGYYEGDIDGGFGEQTLAAVEQFQADQQLFVDGVVGPATWNALSRELEKR
ncbi:MAG: peptidoglycan-binding protein [Cyanobacteria bacterium P01_D01_bin.105]